jgi:hypothetical protein
MHASHFDPRLLTAGFAALVVAFLLALAPSLPEIQLGSSGGSAAEPATAVSTAPRDATGEPRWVTDPLRAPAP